MGFGAGESGARKEVHFADDAVADHEDGGEEAGEEVDAEADVGEWDDAREDGEN